MKRTHYIYTTIFSSLVLTSCLGDLDVKPTEVIDQQIAFQSVNDLNAGVLGVYAGISTNSIAVSAYISDECMLPAENNTNKGVTLFAWKQDPVNTDAIAAWQNLYMVVDRANRILETVDEVPLAPNDTVYFRQLKGELLALRAYGHFELLKHYAVGYTADAPGIPLMLESTSGKPARETSGRVFAQIDTDLSTAAGLIPASFTNAARINLIAVKALQARSALWQQRWDDAIAAATAVINAVPLATAAQFPDIWTDKNNTEIVWKLRREAADARVGDHFRDGTGKILFAPAAKLMQSMDAANDLRYGAWFRQLDATRWAVGKYFGGQPAYLNLADVKLIRVSEMYLIRAEAYASKGAVGLTAGASDLNTLRGVRINGYTAALFADNNALLDAVMQERYKELAFEGHRYFDLRRRGLDIQRIAPDAVQAPQALRLTSADKGYYMPIPLRETQANENISQHPLYSK
ncbi:RagB/SusD family nutrient uptake outer membrane protein [Chitinophaga lutea]